MSGPLRHDSARADEIGRVVRELARGSLLSPTGQRQIAATYANTIKRSALNLAEGTGCLEDVALLLSATGGAFDQARPGAGQQFHELADRIARSSVTPLILPGARA